MKRGSASPSDGMYSFDWYLAHYLPHQKPPFTAALNHRPGAPAASELWSAEELHHAMCSIEALANQGRWQLGLNQEGKATFVFVLLPCFD